MPAITPEQIAHVLDNAYPLGMSPSCVEVLAQIIRHQQEQLRVAREALRTAAVRLRIMEGRARGFHEVTGRHELLDEATMFAESAEQALSLIGER